MTLFTLNAHKKCIGQFNFNPLLYYGLSGLEIISKPIYLELPGTYTIKYKSGAICSYNIDLIMHLLSSNNQNIDKHYYYWNRYYESSALMQLGQYDITYFPTSTILIGCFQCQFGTLPGFTDTGYKTRTLADTFNSIYLSNNNNSYSYTDKLTFLILLPQNLIFWYTNIALQSTIGSITYTIDYTSNTLKSYYLNDISIIGVNKQDISKYSFENYYLDLYKSNFLESNKKVVAKAWIYDINNRISIHNICDFNTVGYLSAYINDIRYTDTLNYEKKYSLSYYWQLIKKNLSGTYYKFIGKFNNTDEDLLLYSGYYTMFLASLSGYTNKFIDGNTYDASKLSDMTFLPSALLENNIECKFSIENVDYLKFLFLKDDFSIYLYKGLVSINDLNTYINNMNNDIQFLTYYDEKSINTVLQYNKEFFDTINNIVEYNENIYNYYLDVSLYEYYNSVQNPIFYIYASQNIKNKLSIGPFKDVATASASISSFYNDIALANYTCELISNNKLIIYEVKKQTNLNN